MRANRFVLVAAGLSMLLWTATPALAGHGHGGGNLFGLGDAEGHGGGHAFGFGRVEKHGGDRHFGNSDNPHGNKHGQLRGLERPNKVAGEHGKWGRNNAGAHHSEHDSSRGDDHDE